MEDLLRLTKMFHKVNPYTTQICSSILNTIIFSVLYTMEQENTSNTTVENIKNYIDNHYSEEIANACGFSSQAHFSTYFKKLNHTTPQDFRKKYNLI